MLSSSIEAANKEAESIVYQVEKSSSENDPEGNSVTAESKAMKRGPYVKFSQQAKVAVAKYAAEHGVAAGLCHSRVRQFLIVGFEIMLSLKIYS